MTDLAPRRFHGVAHPAIDGRPLPPIKVTVEFGARPLFLLSSLGTDPGELTWIAADDEDATVTGLGTGRITVRLGPRNAPTAPPMWWADAGGPLAGMALPVGAGQGEAHFTITGGTLTGEVSLHGHRLTGEPTRYTARVTAQAEPSPGAAGPAAPAAAPEQGVPEQGVPEHGVPEQGAPGHGVPALLAQAGPAPPDRSLPEPYYRMELRSYAQELVRLGRYTEAKPALAEAARRYRAAAETAAGDGAAVSELISLLFLTDHQAHCALQTRDYPALLTHLEEAVRLRGRLDSVATTEPLRADLRQAMVKLTDRVERWRAMLESDWERIQAMDDAAAFHGRLVCTLADLGDADGALAASELARARAFADLLAGRTARRVTPERLRAALAAYGGPVVEYFLHGDRLLIFSMRGDGPWQVTERRVDRAELAARIARFHEITRSETVDDRAWPEVRELLRGLGELLWDPVPGLPGDPETPVLVVPHGELLRVPFAALICDDGRYLVERHAPALLPAVALLSDLLERSGPAGPPTLAALVDPEPMPGGLAPLPGLRERFSAVSGLYGPDRATVRTGPAATAAALRAAQATVLCLATHAEADDADPMASYVALAGAAVSAAEVYRMELRAQLVILAACGTGAGRLSADGVLGLSRAFLARGPAAVLMTLWKVTPRDSLILLRRFHEHHLGRGLGYARALRAAQASFAADYPRHPQRWAAYHLFGLPAPRRTREETG